MSFVHTSVNLVKLSDKSVTADDCFEIVGHVINYLFVHILITYSSILFTFPIPDVFDNLVLFWSDVQLLKFLSP